ncbi:MAG TPA: glycosyltransferase family 61 protein [Propionibacteriaceae bacterium]
MSTGDRWARHIRRRASALRSVVTATVPVARPGAPTTSSVSAVEHKPPATSRSARPPKGGTVAPVGLSLARYASFLPQKSRRRVALLAHAGLGEALARLVSEFAEDDTFVLSALSSPDWGLDEAGATFLPAETLGQLNTRLKTIGPVDVIVDLRRADATAEGDAWRTLFFHLAPKGVYVVASASTPRPSAPQPSSPVLQADSGEPGAPESLALFLRRYWEPVNPDEVLSRLDKELIVSSARFVVDRNYLLVEKRQRHYVKLRENEVGRMLPQRNTRDTVTTVATLPAGELQCRGEVVSHPSSVPILNMALSMPYPQLSVQHYEGKIGVVSNSLLFADSTILPGSYRYPLARVVTNPRLGEVNRDFGRIADELQPKKKMPGSYYHVDCWHTGHFGHIISEVVGRLWGWPEAKRQFPDLKAIFRRRFPNERHPAIELSLFTAYGMEPSDIVWIDEPVWVDSIVTATPMWQNTAPYYVHPGIEQTWQRLREGQVVLRADLPTKIFVSRRETLRNRFCRNIAAVETFFAARGFTLVYPEELSFAEQAALFGGAEVVAGFAGSGLYNILYSHRLSTLIVLAHEAYTARYEHLYTMVLGCTTHYFWSTPDIPHPPGRWTTEAYYSEWEFDFDRNAATLAQTLDRL